MGKTRKRPSDDDGLSQELATNTRHGARSGERRRCDDSGVHHDDNLRPPSSANHLRMLLHDTFMEDSDGDLLDEDENSELHDDSEDEYNMDYENFSEDEFEESETEESEHVIPGKPEHIFKLSLSRYGDEEYEWLDNFEVRCTTSDGTDVGYASGRYISRERIRANFWEEMEGPSQEMSDLAFGVFDRYGNVQRDFKEHCIRRGTGVWQNELDYGPIFLVEEAHITAREWRRMGLGQAMVNLLLQKAEDYTADQYPDFESPTHFLHLVEDIKKRGRLHAFVGPGCLENDLYAQLQGKSLRARRKIREQASNSSMAFYRSLGFRRIGTSTFFAYSYDPNHKSHKVSIPDDCDPPLSETDEDSDDDKPFNDLGFFSDGKLIEKQTARLKMKLPLHYATLAMRDAECVVFYKTYATNNEANWVQVDKCQDTLLHVAARQVKPNCIKWLLENVSEAQAWRSTPNLSGYTPLEVLQAKLEIRRTLSEMGSMTIDVSDNFRGFPPDAVACLSVLLNLGDGQPVSTIQTLRLKYGCTCGECLEGFLSPRMKLVLLDQAYATSDILQQMIEDGEMWSELHMAAFEHIAYGVYRDFRTNKSLRRGFQNTFFHVASCLKSEAIPRVENILNALHDENEWTSETRNYLNRSGTPEGIQAVLETLFDKARNKDRQTAAGLFVPWQEQLKLKVCRNDHEFEFVAWACGLPRRSHGLD